MKNLKDVIASDNRQVFIDLNEFAEYVEIDGVLLQAQIQFRTEKISALQSENYDTLHGDFTKIFFRTADYCKKNERLPHQGEYVHINKKMYRVLTCKDEMGITRLQVSGYRQEQLRQTPFQRVDNYGEVWGISD